MRKPIRAFVAALIALTIGWCAAVVQAETLYKYTDKDGKVTYSDRVPKAGEKAEAVGTDKADKIGNTVKLETKDGKGVQQQFSDIKARGDARVAARDKLQKDVDAAEQRLTKARKALETGRDPEEGERRVIVRPGGNSVQRNETYYVRIAGLEASVKKAEEALAAALEKYNRNAP